MPPRKAPSPKEKFFERGQELLQDAANSANPTLAKLRTKMAERYFEQDVLGDAKVSPRLGLFIGVLYVCVAVIACGYYASDRALFTPVLIAFILFALMLFLFLFALTGVMTESTIAKIIVRMWDRVVGKIPFGKSAAKDEG